MFLPTAILLVQATENAPRASSVLQAVLLGILIIFVFSVFAAGFTAKRIENLHEPSYAKAFGATLLKNLVGWTAFFVFGGLFQAPMVVTLIVAMAAVPILVYKLVFSAMWVEAGLIWIVALVVEVAVGYGLVLIGVLRLAALTGG